MGLLQLVGVTRVFASSTPDLAALRSVNLRISAGEFVAIEGPSGGGKSTLLNILGLLDYPTAGTYLLDANAVPLGESADIAQLRSRNFGFVFQSYNLLESRPVIDSVELGLLYRGVDRDSRRDLALRALSDVGLEARAFDNSSKLSGGQRQRVAIARAIASRTPIILADEPTGNLDSENTRKVVAKLKELNQLGTTIVIVTHDPEVARVAHRRLEMRDGRLRESQALSSGLRQEALLATPQLKPTRDPIEPGKIRARDVLRDANASVRARRTSSLALVSAVTVAVALAITTLGLSASASAQVSSTFDAHLNREVTVSWVPEHSGPNVVRSEDAIERLDALSGVDFAAMLVDYGSATIEASAIREGRMTQLHTAAGDFEAAARLSIEWGVQRQQDVFLGPNELLIGKSLATQLELGPLLGRPIVSVDGANFSVAGLILDSPRMPLLMGEVILSASAELPPFGASRISAVVLTQSGAAQQVAAQIPLVLSPDQPDHLIVDAPIDPTELRGEIEEGVQTVLLAFTGLALLAAIAALTNAMLLAVTARRAEIGLRKALGARAAHIASLIACESALIGLVGGVLGLLGGLAGILLVTISQRWTPVFDLRLAPVAVGAGLVIGALGGVIAATRAARIRPAEALKL